MRTYSESDVASISGALGEAVAATISGQEGWQVVGELFWKFFPGAAFSLSNFNPHSDYLCSAFGVNWNPEAMLLYEQQFAAINPWLGMWDAVPVGTVATSERVFPSRSMAGRPFYEEWLKPHGEVDAAAGIKLKGQSGWVLHNSIHYPLRLAGRYDTPMEAVLDRLKPIMTLAVESSTQVAQGWVSGASHGALSPVAQKIGFVVDTRRHLHTATDAGERVLKSGRIATLINRELHLLFHEFDVWLGARLFDLRATGATTASSVVGNFDEGHWRAEIWLLPKPPSMLPVAVADRFLLVLTEVTREIGRVDGCDVAKLFALTPAEQRVCELLARGLDPTETADALGVSRHTVRSQLKSAMHKMGCRRQTDIVRWMVQSNLH